MEQLGIDIKQLLAQLINFILFFIIFKKFIASPFTHFLDEEKRKEKEREEILAKLKLDEESSTQEKARLKEEWREETNKLLQQARKEAEAIKNELIAEAKKEAEEIRNRGKQQLEEEREKLNKAVKERMIDLSVNIVDKAFKEYLDEETKKKITQYILNNLGKKVVYYEN